MQCTKTSVYTVFSEARAIEVYLLPNPPTCVTGKTFLGGASENCLTALAAAAAAVCVRTALDGTNATDSGFNTCFLVGKAIVVVGTVVLF